MITNKLLLEYLRINKVPKSVDYTYNSNSTSENLLKTIIKFKSKEKRFVDWYDKITQIKKDKNKWKIKYSYYHEMSCERRHILILTEEELLKSIKDCKDKQKAEWNLLPNKVFL